MNEQRRSNARFTAVVLMTKMRDSSTYDTLVHAEPFIPPWTDRLLSVEPFPAFINDRTDLEERCPLTGEPSSYKKNLENLRNLLRGSELRRDMEISVRSGFEHMFTMRIGDAILGIRSKHFLTMLACMKVDLIAGDYRASWESHAEFAVDPPANAARPRITLTQQEADYIVATVNNAEQRRRDLDVCTVFVNLVARIYTFTAVMVNDFPQIRAIFDTFDVEYANTCTAKHRDDASKAAFRSDPFLQTTLLMLESKVVKPALTRLRALKTVINNDVSAATFAMRSNSTVNSAFISSEPTARPTPTGRVPYFHRINTLPVQMRELMSNVRDHIVESHFV
jgi:hypothetical protein